LVWNIVWWYQMLFFVFFQNSIFGGILFWWLDGSPSSYQPISFLQLFLPPRHAPRIPPPAHLYIEVYWYHYLPIPPIPIPQPLVSADTSTDTNTKHSIHVLYKNPRRGASYYNKLFILYTN
jgi:hypothetical protein